MSLAEALTYEQWLRMPEVRDAVEEVVAGEVRISPVSEWRHALIINRVYHQLAPQIDGPDVMVISSPLGLVIRRSPLTVRVPDLTVFKKDTMVVEDGYVHSAPQLAVEVISRSDTPSTIADKLADYAALGVPEAWVVSPEARTVEVLYLEDSRLHRVQLLAEGILTPRHFPGVHVDIAEIWPE